LVLFVFNSTKPSSNLYPDTCLAEILFSLIPIQENHVISTAHSISFHKTFSQLTSQSLNSIVIISQELNHINSLFIRLHPLNVNQAFLSFLKITPLKLQLSNKMIFLASELISIIAHEKSIHLTSSEVKTSLLSNNHEKSHLFSDK